MASSEAMKLSRSVSILICSTVWPVCLGQYFVESVTRSEHFPGVDLHIGRLALKAAQGLVDHHAGVGQAETLAFGAPGEQHGAHAGRLADADGAHLGADELHGVVNGQARAHDAAGRVDVQGDVLVRVLGLEEQHLGDDDVRHVVIDRPDDEDDPFLEEAGVDVLSPLAARSLLYDDGDQVQGSFVHDDLLARLSGCRIR